VPALSLVLLAAALVVVPGPMPARRRLAWLAAARWDGTRVDENSPQVRFPGADRLRFLRAERNREQDRAELAATVGALRDEYAAGATIAAAFTAASALPGRCQTALGRAAALARQGADVTPALVAEPRLASLAVACDLAARNGAPLTGALAGVHAELMAEQRAARAVRTALAGPRSSALLLAGLPLIGLAMGSAMGAAPQRVLLHTGAGRLALVVGATLDFAGLAWTLALSRRALAGLQFR
jgi:tight adherence protein B